MYKTEVEQKDQKDLEGIDLVGNNRGIRRNTNKRLE